ncbi:hypothetical protein EYF80_003233 [Liparis tanakae]|uniref:Uncharacterized protein n=1 Tax=Liparis tanakae TaxID=230148 RepID=A0A4Z2J9T8_9TELE|nr:hypothetical protein EYF80_003233 [Liparis tanakae]
MVMKGGAQSGPRSRGFSHSCQLDLCGTHSDFLGSKLTRCFSRYANIQYAVLIAKTSLRNLPFTRIGVQEVKTVQSARREPHKRGQF